MTDIKVKESISENAYELCIKAKQQRKFSKQSQSKANIFLERIYINIQNSLSATFKEKRYFLLNKNDVSKMFFVYIMRIKNKILFILKAFKIWIEKQTEKQIKRIRADDELRCNVFNDWFEKTDIQWKLSISNTFEQKNVIERKIYIIVSSIKVIYKIYSVLMRLWDYIIEKIVYI